MHTEKLDPDIAIMQAAEDRQRNDRANAVSAPVMRRIFIQGVLAQNSIRKKDREFPLHFWTFNSYKCLIR